MGSLELLRDKFGRKDADEWVFKNGGFNIRVFMHYDDFILQYQDGYDRGREYARVKLVEFLDKYFGTVAVMRESIETTQEPEV